MLRDIQVEITYFDNDLNDLTNTYTRGVEYWIDEHDYRQYIHANSDRIKSLNVLKW